MKCNRMSMRLALAGALALAGLGLASPARAGSVCYLVTADTTGLSGALGFLDVQLSASTVLASPTVTATITDVSTDGTLGSVAFNNAATGSFSNTPLSIDNVANANTFPSELQQNFTYGTTLSFEVTLSGSEINPTSNQPFTGTIFTFTMQDANGNGLSQGPLTGEAVALYVNPTPPLSNVMLNTYGPASGGYPTVTAVPCSVVPEPSSAVLLGLGAGAVLAFGRSRRPR